MNRSKLYNFLYDEAQMIFDEYNLCDIRDGKCLSYRTGCYSTNFCCDGCKHLTKKGCRAKAIWCKTWYCRAILNNPKNYSAVKRLTVLQRTAYLLFENTPIFRKSKGEIL